MSVLITVSSKESLSSLEIGNKIGISLFLESFRSIYLKESLFSILTFLIGEISVEKKKIFINTISKIEINM